MFGIETLNELDKVVSVVACIQPSSCHAEVWVECMEVVVCEGVEKMAMDAN